MMKSGGRDKGGVMILRWLLDEYGALFSLLLYLVLWLGW